MKMVISDKRLNRNLEDIENPIEHIMGICGQKYDMLGHNEKQIGLIAEEVEKIIPEVVVEKKIDDDYHRALGLKTIKAIKYHMIIPILTEAIKEQQEVIKKLEKRITLLENK